MTMTSPVELAYNGHNRTGWFDSLKRTRKNKADKAHMTNARSLTSLHTVAVHAPTTTTSASAILARHVDQNGSGDTVHSADDKKKGAHSSSAAGKPPKPSAWRVLLGRPKKAAEQTCHSSPSSSLSTSHHAVVAVVGSSRLAPLPVAAVDRPEGGTAFACATLPRKRPDRGGVTDVAVANRDRAFTSAATLGRQSKRSTVWYTHSESDIRASPSCRVSPSLFSLRAPNVIFIPNDKMLLNGTMKTYKCIWFESSA